MINLIDKLRDAGFRSDLAENASETLKSAGLPAELASALSGLTRQEIEALGEVAERVKDAHGVAAIEGGIIF